MKKHLKWLIPVVAILVIGIAAAAFFVVQQIGEKTPEVQEEEVIEIYWNLDAEKYRGEEAELRTPSEGKYRAAFAGGGKKVDLFFADAAMMNLADSYDVMGLVVDENNYVTKVVDVYEFTGGVAAYKYYVDTFTEDTICTNSSLTFRAQNLTLKIDENTVIYDIGSIGPLAGQPAELTHGCEITALQNKRGIVTHIFMSPPFEKSPVYWNVKRMYNSTTKSSTREADLVGTYTIRFAVDGEVVELKCKSQKVVNTIDGYAGRCMHLEFDEEGYISAARAPSYATGNGSVASWFHIMEFTDNGFTAEKFSGSDKGTVKTVSFSQDVKIFDVSTSGDDAGKPTTLRLHDQVHCLRDSAGDVCIVFVVSRFADAEIYWNLEVKYDKTAKRTTRVPDTNGYYVYRMFHDGEYVTLRTKDRDVANVIDSRSAKCCGLVVEGDIITYADNPKIVWNGTPVGSNQIVTKITKDGVLHTEKEDKSATYSAPLAEDCKVYNMTKYASWIGEETSVRVNDKVYPLGGVDGKIHTIFVIGRSSDSPLYWNLDRSYDSTNKVTKRVPEADGYYYFRMLKDRKIVTVRTKDKEMASKIDSWVACGFKLSGDKIVDAFKYTSVNNYDGGSFASWCDIAELSNSKITAFRLLSGSDYGKVHTGTFASGYKVYDVSPTAEIVGEETKLRVGDRIQGFMNKQKKVTAVYVISRTEDVPVVRFCDSCQMDTLWYNWDGASAFSNGRHYYLAEDTVQTLTGTVEKGRSNCFDLNGKTLTGAADILRNFNIFGTLNLYDTVGTGKVVATKAGASIAPVFYVHENATFNMYGGTLTAEHSSNRAGVGIIEKSVMNMYGGVLENGKTTSTANNQIGANLEVLSYSFFYMYGGTIRGGNAAGYGGNIASFASAEIYLLGGTIEGGAAGIAGQDVYAKGNVTVGGDVKIGELYLLSGKKIAISDEYPLTDAASIGVTMDKTGAFTDAVDSTFLDKFHSCLAFETVVQDQDGKLTFAAANKYCESCEADVVWTAWDGDTAFADGGHYYLANNVTLGSVFTIDAGKTVCLDLNGKTATGSTSATRMFNIKGMFSVMDSCQTGKLVGNKENGQAPVFSVYPDATFKLYGGTLTSNFSAPRAGVGMVQEGTMYMYGGTLENGVTTSADAKHGGGNLELLPSACFYMYGGKICGGTSASYGGNISAYASAEVYLLGGVVENGTSEVGGYDVGVKGNVTVGGDIRIGDLYLLSGKKVKISEEYPLTDDASIGITMDKADVFTDVVDSAVVDKFHSCMFETIVQNAEGKLAFEVTDSLCEACQKEVSWKAWDGAAAFTDGGHYYLAESLTMGSVRAIDEGKTVCLQLNGKTLTGSTSASRMFNIKGTFSLMDCGRNGRLVGNKENGQAPVFSVYPDATFNLYGGTLTSNYSAPRAGVGMVQEGTMYMYGGTLENGVTTSTDAKHGGGNLELLPSARFYMYGGKISGGTSASYGGNISAYSSAEVYLLGGVIENGTSATGGNDLCAKGNITVGGDVQIGEVYLFDTKKIRLDDENPLKDGASIGVAMENPGVFTDAVDAAVAGYFKAASTETLTQNAEGQLVLIAHRHCICNGADVAHSCNDSQVWQPWPADNAWQSGKYYYLTSDVSDMPSINVQEGETLNLCLNGFDYTGSSSTFRLFVVYGTLNICDHKHGDVYEGTVTATYDAVGKMAPVFRVYSTATFNMYGGNYTATNEMLEAGLGVVDSGRMNIYDGKLYGGRVTTTKSTQGGGNLDIFGTGKVVMYDGIITDGQSALNGSNVYMNNANAVFEMRGGVISGGIAQNGAVSGKGTVILGGDARITGNTGGNIYLFSDASVTILDDFTGFAGVTLQNDTGAFGTSNIDITGLLVSDAGYVITQKDGVLTMEADN